MVVRPEALSTSFSLTKSFFMEYKFVVSLRRQFKNREAGLKNSILRTILVESNQETYNADEISSLASEIENTVKYKELSELKFSYSGDSYTFKVDSMDMLIQGEDNVCLQEHSAEFVNLGMDKFCKRFETLEEYDIWMENNPLKRHSTT